MIYRIDATANIDAEGDTEVQGKLDAIARILSDGDGELGYDWHIDAEPVEGE